MTGVEGTPTGEPAWLYEPGRQVSHLRIMRPLGRGGMAEVYLARDTKLGRKVALKIVKPEALGDEEAVERFLFEARATARFSHPNIVTIYEVGEDGGHPFVALEYLEGQTLRQRLEQDLPSVPEAIRIAEAIAGALAEAHARAIQHRDLKPENVILARDGRLRVLDFGMARVFAGDDRGNAPHADLELSRVQDPFESAAKGLRGSPAYMAPEQWEQRETTGAADVWALGIILHEMLSGKRPYEAGSVVDLALKICADEPLPPLDRVRPVPAGLAALVRECLAKDPDERPTARGAADRLRSMLGTDRDRLPEEESPFRGLMPFSEQHAHFFFGRDAEIAAFVERMRTTPVLTVLGPSGAGKSSFVQAGVVPRLRERGALVVLQVRPGRDPFLTLAARIVSARRQASVVTTESPFGIPESPERGPDESGPEVGETEMLAQQLRASPHLLNLVLHRLADRRRASVILFVDQLEELYALVDEEAMRRRYMESICTAADDAQMPVRVVLTLREEFLSRLAEGTGVREALSQITLLRSPGRAALREILLRPVEAFGYAWDDATLVDTMVDEVQGEIACLPLLQFAGQKLWEGRDRTQRLLRRSTYDAAAGVAGALAQHADGVLATMTAQEVRLARTILLRLVTPELTRRVMAGPRLLEGLEPEAQGVLQRLVAARLLTGKHADLEGESEGELELAHEALIVTWERLARWIDESREEIVLLDEVGRAAELWQRRGRRDEEVWQGDALHDAQRAIDNCTSEIPSTVSQFLHAGYRKELRRIWRRRGVVAAAFVALAALTGFFAVKERETRAQRNVAQEREADALRESATSALTYGSPGEARGKLRASLEVRDSAASRGLWARLEQDPLLWRRELTDILRRVAFFPDGSHVVFDDYVGTVYIVDTTNGVGETIRTRDYRAPSAFTRDGSHYAFADPDGRILLWDLANRSSRLLGSHDAAVVNLRFSPDGKVLATGSHDGTVRLWRLEPGAEQTKLSGHTQTGIVLGFSLDGSRVVTSGVRQAVFIWDVTSGRKLIELPFWYGGVFGRDVHHLAVVDAADPDELARFEHYDPISGEKIRAGRTQQLFGEVAANSAGTSWAGLDAHGGMRILGETGRIVRTLRAEVDAVRGDFLAGGDQLVVGYIDGTVRLWDLASQSVIGQVRACDVAVRPIADRSERFVLTACNDRTVQLWRADRLERREPTEGHADRVTGLAVFPSGLIATGSGDETVRAWEVETGVVVDVLELRAGAVGFPISASPDGETAAIGFSNGSIELWRPRSGAPTVSLVGHGGPLTGTQYSGDGKLLATTSGLAELKVWDVGTREVKRDINLGRSGSLGVSITSDARIVAVGPAHTAPRLYDVATGREIVKLEPGPTRLRYVAFSRDDALLAAGSSSGEIEIWNMTTGRRRVLGHHTGDVWSLAFHPDGRRLGTASRDGTARIWDLESGESVVLGRHGTFDVNQIRFTADGELAVTTGDDRAVRTWNVATATPFWRAPVMMPRSGAPPMLLSHRGWESISTPREPVEPPDAAWRRAADQAFFGTGSADGRILCLMPTETRFEMWNTRTDSVAVSRPAPVEELVATPRGCFAKVGREVTFYDRSGGKIVLCDNAGVVDGNEDDVLVACGEELYLFDAGGVRLASFAMSQAATALAVTHDAVITGNASGRLLRSSRGGGEPRELALDRTPPAPVTQIEPGPAGTVVAGFGDGILGLWDLQTGARLRSVRLHGRVLHLRLRGQSLYAASELGDTRAWDLGVYHRDYCDLMQDVWRDVPLVWQGGRPVLAEPPAQHPCAGTGGSLGAEG